MFNSARSLCEEQGKFRVVLLTFNQCLILQRIIHSYKCSTKKAPVIAFLDIKAAYDSVRQPYNFNKACAKIGDKTTGSFSMPSGVQQGSIISPYLYSIFIDGIREKLQSGGNLKIYEGPTSLKMMMEKGEKFNLLMYADDIFIHWNLSRVNSGYNGQILKKWLDLVL